MPTPQKRKLICRQLSKGSEPPSHKGRQRGPQNSPSAASRSAPSNFKEDPEAQVQNVSKRLSWAAGLPSPGCRPPTPEQRWVLRLDGSRDSLTGLK